MFTICVLLLCFFFSFVSLSQITHFTRVPSKQREKKRRSVLFLNSTRMHAYNLYFDEFRFDAKQTLNKSITILIFYTNKNILSERRKRLWSELKEKEQVNRNEKIPCDKLNRFDNFSTTNPTQPGSNDNSQFNVNFSNSPSNRKHFGSFQNNFRVLVFIVIYSLNNRKMIMKLLTI